MTRGVVLDTRYRLGELLGVGATGSVFAATDRQNQGRRVAVKLLHPHLCSGEAAREAFLRQARYLMELSHPNVVTVHGAGIYDAAGVLTPWIAFDLLTGPTLQRWVADGPRPGHANAVAISEGILAGLGAAHRAGLVHRDISPANVVLEGVGAERTATTAMVRLVDFGLAALEGTTTVGGDVLLTGGQEPAPAAQRQVVGNPAYMSPEQARGLPVTTASDVYQVGAVLYFVLTGEAPYPRDTVQQVMQAHLAAPPPVPSAIAPEGQPLDRVVTRAMAKDQSERYVDVDEFAAALRAAPPLAGSSGTLLMPAAKPARTVLHRHPSPSPAAVTPRAPVARPGYLETRPAEVVPAARHGSTGAVVAVALLLVAVVVAIMQGALGSATVAEGDIHRTVGPSPASSVPGAPFSPTTEPSATVAGQATASVEARQTSVEPAPITVPTLYGTISQADAALKAAGLRLGSVERVDAAESADRVLDQLPDPGQAVAPGTRVDVTVASGSNAVPDVSGQSVANATALLQSAGFVVALSPADASATAPVAEVQPSAGSVVKVGATVTLVATPPVQASAPTPTSTASPSPSPEHPS